MTRSRTELLFPVKRSADAARATKLATGPNTLFVTVPNARLCPQNTTRTPIAGIAGALKLIWSEPGEPASCRGCGRRFEDFFDFGMNLLGFRGEGWLRYGGGRKLCKALFAAAKWNFTGVSARRRRINSGTGLIMGAQARFRCGLRDSED
jgi:hypothetical protein